MSVRTMSPKQTMNRKRRISNFQTTTVDCISECPDALLLHILSLLPIKDAVKTEVLSKRWHFLWTFLPSLLFHYQPSSGYYDSDMINNFVTFVDKALFSSNCSKIKKFGVDFPYDQRFASSVNSWTRFVAGKGVEELCLELQSYFIDDDEFYELPQLMYANSCFKELHFSFCGVTPKGKVAWNSLKKLSIESVELTEDVIEKILTGSPVLEILELCDCNGFTRLAVTNSRVKKLILRHCLDDWDDSELEISAPFVLSLEMYCSLGSNCRLTNVSSLVDAVFNSNFRCDIGDQDNDYERIQNIAVVFLASLLHVKNLTLGSWAIEVLSTMEAKGLTSPLMNCKCLTLDTHVNKYIFLGIANMLKSTPSLEALIMTGSGSSSGLAGILSTELLNYNEEQYWTSQMWTYKCLTLHLKSVTISCDFMHHCNSNFLSFLQFLLKNARVLQKITINTRSDAQLKEHFQAAKKLLSFPRSSPDAVVIFC